MINKNMENLTINKLRSGWTELKDGNKVIGSLDLKNKFRPCFLLTDEDVIKYKEIVKDLLSNEKKLD